MDAFLFTCPYFEGDCVLTVIAVIIWRENWYCQEERLTKQARYKARRKEHVGLGENINSVSSSVVWTHNNNFWWPMIFLNFLIIISCEILVNCFKVHLCFWALRTALYGSTVKYKWKILSAEYKGGGTDSIITFK